MNSVSIKDNALRIIAFNHPAKIEVCVPMRLLAYQGCNHEGFHNTIKKEQTNRWQDIWGTTWQLHPDGISEMPVDFPLKGGKNELLTYRWPNPCDERIIKKIHSDFKKSVEKADGFLTGFHRDLLWEKSCMLAGMENMMIWFKTEPYLAKDILRHIMDFQVSIAQEYLSLGVEMVKFGDDLGGQRNALFSHQIFEEFILPEYQRLFNLYRENDILIYFHSCGKIESFIDDFLRLGVNVLNPVQATANNLEMVREKTNGRIALEGGVNSAVVMHEGRQQIEEEVKKRILQLGKDGGYFCKPDQVMPYPQENMDAFINAVNTYGKFPLDD